LKTGFGNFYRCINNLIRRKKMKGLNWIVVIAGVWELVAPFILGYANVTAALWNAIIVGILFIILGAWAALTADAATSKTLDWIAVVVGIWLIIAPFVLGYTAVTVALWNAIIVGIIAAACAFFAALRAPTAPTLPR
jgi:hypothetical protein